MEHQKRGEDEAESSDQSICQCDERDVCSEGRRGLKTSPLSSDPCGQVS